MSHHRLSLLVLALALGACVAKPTDVLPGPAGNGSPRPKATEPGVKATATPGGGASKDPAKPAAVPLLKAPGGAVSVLTGRVSIDAHYAVTSGGSQLIGLDGGSLIGQDGGSLIGEDGASAVFVGGSLIGQDGGSLMGMDGGSLVAAGAGNLIGQDGGSLVAAGAGNLIGKRKLALMQAKKGLSIGAVLPAALIELAIRDMSTGALVPLGVDADGKQVLSIFTNNKGEYRVHLPADLAGHNLLVTATVPGTKDVRLVYDAVSEARAGGASVEVDEDTRLVAAYFREAFASRMERVFKESQGTGADGEFANLVPVALRSERTAMIGERMTDAARAVGAATETLARRRARALATTDALLARVKINDEAFTIDLDEDGKAGQVLDEIRAQLRWAREAAKAKMNADPQFFKRQAYIQTANGQLEPGQAPYEIKRPSDLSEFIKDYVLRSEKRDRIDAIEQMYLSLGLDAVAAKKKREGISLAMDKILYGVAAVLFNFEEPGTPAYQANEKALDEAVAAIGRDPGVE